ncbi:uncharacterized protein G2W53_026148 [Senna tora]|uniref:Uncharacterized protein n=1 Tax=Senna tora TaxID=362788 RepID=A0A834TEJ5_9FABA|nr:uncharacterized protein G2W53_026148 [Senna tora]
MRSLKRNDVNQIVIPISNTIGEARQNARSRWDLLNVNEDARFMAMDTKKVN